METEEGPLKIICLDEVAQQQVLEYLGHRAPEGGGDVASYNHKALSHQWIVNVGHSSVEYAKQASYK